jgi:hypothetical protein
MYLIKTEEIKTEVFSNWSGRIRYCFDVKYYKNTRELYLSNYELDLNGRHKNLGLSI